MSVDWKVAGALEQLRVQLNEHAPRRSAASDGSIGDAAHASRDSDHNPWWRLAGQAYVTARDFTHDPGGGLDANALAAALCAGRDQRVKYVIWDRHIMAGDAGPSPWRWRTYSGSNPHTKHLHLSVVPDARALSRIPWLLPGLTSTARRKEDELSRAEVDEINRNIGFARDQIMTHLGKHPASPPLPAGALPDVEVARRVDVGYARDQLRDDLDELRTLVEAIAEKVGVPLVDEPSDQ